MKLSPRFCVCLFWAAFVFLVVGLPATFGIVAWAQGYAVFTWIGIGALLGWFLSVVVTLLCDGDPRIPIHDAHLWFARDAGNCPNDARLFYQARQWRHELGLGFIHDFPVDPDVRRSLRLNRDAPSFVEQQLLRHARNIVRLQKKRTAQDEAHQDLIEEKGQFRKASLPTGLSPLEAESLRSAREGALSDFDERIAKVRDEYYRLNDDVECEIKAFKRLFQFFSEMPIDWRHPEDSPSMLPPPACFGIVQHDYWTSERQCWEALVTKWGLEYEDTA